MSIGTIVFIVFIVLMLAMHLRGHGHGHGSGGHSHSNETAESPELSKKVASKQSKPAKVESGDHRSHSDHNHYSN